MTKLSGHPSFSIELLIGILQNSDDYNRKAEAAKSLGHVNDTRVVQALIDATRDESAIVSAAAIEALCKIGNKDTLHVVMAALKHPTPFIRESAVYSILFFDREDPRLLRVVIAALDDEDHFVREAAAFALGEVKKTEAIQALIKTLADEDTEVQDAAMQTLWKNGHYAVDLLGNAWSANKNEKVRGRIAFVLGKIAELSDEIPEVRLKAIQVLGRLGDTDAIESLKALIQLGPNAEVREAARQALEQIKSKS